ncbi:MULTISPECIES: phosphoribosylaminoimidazolesuccinocarboxamide synthase [Campylobacter]|uniref:Phosphoribosylaminoimidazole-succinocarboxamide synthase n=1 Tax=Campylobacter curvus (strain 525.92) TaxID=360105 RepID=PUR7_CAMC5|nr:MULTISPECIES: phosphoribosylaminoimidazolesuccinocarboxamide synthase [Campylobacter]A7GYK7.1 RecName: Full=Phosphoribosylaminoimidazole-succinocarboxamide synthase; AltName: Full=SAICAR synthetase [Campylobacter curvus 525.92]EAU00544.1 phosphoribosylaminoimidazole-succinocarboxamide synthase [Campylobacter curvus 525.92]EJP74422.1 phosphoribosylaminoimidazolesuccinocarboxamide synthase [Campylobacter sp. FOBRC14]MBN7288522.1 phosphoribosylaminoimidazolesuccinocarboxamide synthase [Campylob
MQKRELIYEGKGKKMYATDDANLLIAEFKDDLTAFDAQKRGNEAGKGALNNKISTQIFKILKEKGIETDLVETISDTEQLVKKCEIIPLEVVVRNIATGSLTKRLAIKEGTVLPFPLVEFYFKNDELHDPLVTDEHCLVMGLVKSEKDLQTLRHLAREINSILFKFFEERKLKLVDFKIEFGMDKDGNILLADEISPDSCRFWDADTNEKLDKDRFRQDLGSVKVAYEEVLRRILS